LYFQWWASSANKESDLDLSSKLSAARMRVTSLFLAILFFCWLLQLSAWLIVILLLAVGFAVAIFADGDFTGDIGFLGIPYLVREWAFGFPTLILRPKTQEKAIDEPGAGRLVGVGGLVTSPCRPHGEAEFDGVLHSVVSDEGYLESGTYVIVTRYRNGQPYVKKSE
ncbi:MAG: NfeD family protein, partial [Planctomycetota bacterium]